MHPALQICTYLVEQGFDVTLLGGSRWKPMVEGMGMHFAPLLGLMAGGPVEKAPEFPAEIMTMPLGPLLAKSVGSRFVKLMICSWYAPRTERHILCSLAHNSNGARLTTAHRDALRFALVSMQHRVGLSALRARGIVILADTGFQGALPLQLGADRPPGLEDVTIKTVGIGVVPRFWATPFHGPWGLGMPYDASEGGAQRTVRAHAEQLALYQGAGAEAQARLVLDLLGCKTSVDSLLAGYTTPHAGEQGQQQPWDVCRSLLDAVTVCHNTTLQMGMASLEFPIPAHAHGRGEQQFVPPHLKHAGFLPVKKPPAHLEYPPWFEHDLQNPSSRKPNVILVAQGTATRNYDELIVPTIAAFAGDETALVIAVLCRAGATLDTQQTNVRVLDYFPYDALLPYVDVFVSSSGFGGLTHAVANGVPLVQAGWIVDKPDIGVRVAQAGLGVYLGRETYPTQPAAIKEAVRLVLGNPETYRRRARELQAEASEKYRPLETIRDEIMRLTA